ncbi:PD-(D/E)XK nuclease family protein, partial [candidate division FCPU426 bacterium]|nr:PD-(D/E)XK nuclease family protein [candidate division FCPU426 bacterium]
EELLFTYAQDYGGSRAYKLSRFVLEALELPKTDTAVRPTSAIEKIKAHAFPAPAPQKEAAAISGEEPLSLSYYQIDDYLTCPQKYKYWHVLRIPVLPHHAILYGKALHTAVTEYYRKKILGQSIQEDELVQVFLNSWVNQGYISREHEELRQQTGIQSLKLFIKNDMITPVIPKYIEKSFAYNLGTVKIVGRMDRVDVLPDGKAVIVDFKSSEVFEKKEADKKARESLQLRIYALAWMHLEKKLPARLELYFLDSGIVGSTEPDPDKIRDAEETIGVVAEGIRKRDYTAKPSVWVCNYCPYRTLCPSAAL